MWRRGRKHHYPLRRGNGVQLARGFVLRVAGSGLPHLPPVLVPHRPAGEGGRTGYEDEVGPPRRCIGGRHAVNVAADGAIRAISASSDGCSPRALAVGNP